MRDRSPAAGVVWLAGLLLLAATLVPAARSGCGDCALLRRLRTTGGFILYTRHADRDGKADRLTDRGRARARVWGQALRRAGILSPGNVVTAGTLRTLETALAAFDSPPRTDPDLDEVYRAGQEPALEAAEQAGDSARVAHLRGLLRTRPAPGRNLLVIGSTNIFQRATGRPALAWLETAVLRPDGRGGVIELGRFTAEEFAAWLAGCGSGRTR
ncbi:MAG: hypothetical protein HZC42_05770 [Candidatus Eisenbacteria bacterium]|nr:hypothetical protein [Candidatus Eisenbacteria bacterium]